MKEGKFVWEGEEKGKKGRKGKKEEKIRRKREHKTAPKNRPQRLFLSVRSYFMPNHEISGT